jgi:HEAT repeat protein
MSLRAGRVPVAVAVSISMFGPIGQLGQLGAAPPDQLRPASGCEDPQALLRAIESGPSDSVQGAFDQLLACVKAGSVPVADAVQGLLLSLNQDPSFGREGEGFSGLGPAAAREAAPELIQRLDDPKLRIRCNAARVLGSLGSSAPGASTALIRALRGPVAEVRGCAARALESFTADAAQVVPALIKALHDTDSNVRSDAAESATALGGSSQEAVEALIKALAEDSEIDRPGAPALSDMAATHPEAFERFLELIHGTGHCRCERLLALDHLGTDRAVQEIVQEAAQCTDPVLRATVRLLLWYRHLPAPPSTEPEPSASIGAVPKAVHVGEEFEVHASSAHLGEAAYSLHIEVPRTAEAGQSPPGAAVVSDVVLEIVSSDRGRGRFQLKALRPGTALLSVGASGEIKTYERCRMVFRWVNAGSPKVELDVLGP